MIPMSRSVNDKYYVNFFMSCFIRSSFENCSFSGIKSRSPSNVIISQMCGCKQEITTHTITCILILFCFSYQQKANEVKRKLKEAEEKV